MKYAFAAALAALMIAGAAVAQPTAPTAPAAAVAPAPPVVASPPPVSTCPAYPAQPAVPTAEAIRNTRDLNASTATVNAYLGQYQTVQQCRVGEIERLKAQLEVRVAEAKAAQERALALRDSWQAVGEAVAARGAKQKK